MAGIFHLKYRDTKPILEVLLKDPDGSVHDLTGSTSWKLHILLANSTTVVSRDMEVQGDPTEGTLQYDWQAADWNDLPTPSTATGDTHRMEYEVIGPSSARLTFPNDGYDRLRVIPDIGQG